jgi:SAM-dependent methyltransferase
MTKPIEVFREVNRILKPDGIFAVIYSNRMFPTKAIAIWRMMDDRQHANLIAAYFQQAGNFIKLKARDCTLPSTAYTDPVYVVLAQKGDDGQDQSREA